MDRKIIFHGNGEAHQGQVPGRMSADGPFLNTDALPMRVTLTPSATDCPDLSAGGAVKHPSRGRMLRSLDGAERLLDEQLKVEAREVLAVKGVPPLEEPDQGAAAPRTSEKCSRAGAGADVRLDKPAHH
jgi:hypothetical protein